MIAFPKWVNLLAVAAAGFFGGISLINEQWGPLTLWVALGVTQIFIYHLKSQL